MKNLQSLIIGIFAIFIIGAGAANAANWTVTKSNNSNDGACNADCSLREAVAAADSGDTVVFKSNLAGQTFTLGGEEIVIAKNLTIDGYLNESSFVILSGEMTSRIFHVEKNINLNLKNMTLTKGNGVGAKYLGSGGAISAGVDSFLSLDRVSVRGNQADNGGAIHIDHSTTRFTNSSFTDNGSSGCTAIRSQNGNIYMANVTVSGNYTIQYDGIAAICNFGGKAYIANSTIAYNNGNHNGGIFNGVNAVLTIGNSIVARNLNDFDSTNDIYDIGSTIISVGGNLIEEKYELIDVVFTQPNDIMGVNPLLGPLNSYGGQPVLFHSLKAGSPARNAGLNSKAVDPFNNSPLTNDGRGAGFPRIAFGTVDKGAFEDQNANTSLIVTKKADTDDMVCDVDCSLREAVYQASLSVGADEITFAPNITGTITLGGSEILIQNQNVNIVGYEKANMLTISGGSASRIFRLDNATVNISGLTLANGNGIGVGSFGGAVLADNNSNLTLDRMILSNNFADAYGAIYLKVGRHRVINSTISGNSAKTGFALGVNGTLFMANTTVSGNFDSDGGAGNGAIYVTGTARIRNSTIAFNRASGNTGGGISTIGTLDIGNSIVANNIAAVSPDLYSGGGEITSVGGNLIQNANGFPAGTFNQTNDQTGVDPMLAALADNGGNVTTHLLMPGSPAINTGINANVVDPFDNSILATDARGGGFSRIIGFAVDKGAFESLSPTAAGVTVSGRVMAGKRGVNRATIYLTDQNGESRTARTNSFGYFRFDDIPAGETYIINVFSKSYQFSPQVINVSEATDNLYFTPE